MKNKLLLSIAIIFELCSSHAGFAQAPSITTQPVNQTVCENTSVSFSVAATGANLTYQWRKGIINLVDGGNISGSNTATLTINPVSVTDASSDYNVIVSGSVAPNDTSDYAVLDVNTAPDITMQPVNQTICSGDTAQFSVVATGLNLTYQWKNGSTPLMSGGNILDATSPILKIYPTTIADTSSFYYVVITGGCAPPDSSVEVALLINSTPTITTQPANQKVCLGNAATFSVAASGTGINYQWFNGNTALANGVTISGVNTATLTINPTTFSDTSSFYHVVISGSCPPNDTSVYVSLKIDSTSIITQPSNQIICSGSSASFSVGTNGTGIVYQWFKGNVPLINGGNISGANTATLTINPATISDTSSFYHVIILGTCPPADTSINVSLMINMVSSITTQPASHTVCSSSAVSFSVAASGSGLTYQWMNGNTALTNGGNISGANTATLTINPATTSDTSSFYHVVITGGCAPTDTSANASLVINTIPNITNQPTNQTVCSGNTASFSVGTTGSGLTYQWMNGNTTLSNGGNISGANTASLIINPATISDTSSFYHVVISGACSPNDTSLKVFLHINALPTVIANASKTTVCSGSTVIFTGSGSPGTYTWTNGVQDGVAYTPASTNTYTVTCTDANNCTNTASVMVTVNKLPATGLTSNSPVCIGSAINLNASATSGATYSWSGPNGFTSSNQNPTIPSATTANGGTYSLSVSYNGCSADSTINVTVYDCAGTDLSVVKTVDNTHPMIGNNVVFTITASNKGPNNVTGVVVGDTLQSGFTYVSSTATKGSYNSSTGIWNIDTLNNGATAVLTLTAKVNAAGNYVNTATIHGNSPDSNAVNNKSSVQVFPTELMVPEGFSPNGDGVNDLFVVRAIENYPHNTFTIFNRWGDKVFGASPYQSTWDGKATTGMRIGGDDLPVGTYFYTLDLGDGSKVLKGSIYLNK